MLPRWDRIQEYLFPLATMCCLLVLLAPVPAPLLDVLLTANILLSVVILYTSVSIRTPVEFSIFPTVLLVSTLARLVLNIASTRLILLHGDTQGLNAAGGVVRTFGEFVSGDNLMVGMVIFAIIIVIQFVVITKGATRISEVAARFTLDGLPGRQMAIDADLTSGAITEAEAQRRREELAFQADFFGAMDGASKFVRGDAIAGVVITVVNLLGGLVIGVGQAGMAVGEATATYSKLTIGDGLVSQLPALAVSIAAAVLVTRSTRRTDLSLDFVQQLGNQPTVLAFAGVLLLSLTLTPLPTLPLLALAGACFGAAYWQLSKAPTAPAPTVAARPSKPVRKEQPRVEDYLAIDPVEVELGVALVRLADTARGGDLLAQVAKVRQEVAVEVGIVLPKVRVRDNMALAEHQYRIKISGNPVADGLMAPDEVCAELPEEATGVRPVRPFVAVGSNVPWSVYAAADVSRIRQAGGQIIPPGDVITRHLQHVVRTHAHELLTRDATKHLLDELRKTAPAVVDELIPNVMKVGDVQKTLQALLVEGVPIRQLGLILETLGDFANEKLTSDQQVEVVRQRLARTLCSRYRDRAKRLHVVTLSPELEQRLRQRAVDHSLGPHDARTDILSARLEPYLMRLKQSGHTPIVLVDASLRRLVRELVAEQAPEVVVLSYDEVTADTKVTSVGIVSLAEHPRAAA